MTDAQSEFLKGLRKGDLIRVGGITAMFWDHAPGEKEVIRYVYLNPYYLGRDSKIRLGTTEFPTYHITPPMKGWMTDIEKSVYKQLKQQLLL
jgi:hypothetical protein